MKYPFERILACSCCAGMVHYAYMLEHGLGWPQDLAAAMEWYHKAAVAGSPTAMNNLAKILLEGREASEVRGCLSNSLDTCDVPGIGARGVGV